MEDVRKCETCGRLDVLYVYALPGIAMSVGNCAECLCQDAYPLWIAEANTEATGGLEHAAEWWRESLTFKDGKYVTIAEALSVS